MTKSLDLNVGKASKRINKRRVNEALWGYLCVAPLTIGLLMFLAIPLLYSLYISMTEYDLFNAPKFIGFNNFARIFSANGKEFWKSILNAFVMCIGVFISTALSLLVANILCGKIKLSSLFKSIFFVPTICSSVATTIMWKRMYDYYYGTINQILSFLFKIDHIYWLDENHVVGSIMFMTILFGFGTSMLLYISAIKGIPSQYYEAAQIDGANVFETFFHITVPAVSSITFYILVTGLIGCLQGFTVFQVMTNGSPSNTMMPVLLIFKYSGGDYGSFYGLASAMALILGLIIALLTAFNFLISKKWVYYES